MSRSGYTDDGDNWDMIRWRGAVESAIRGKRGQRLLRELLDALDGMPEPFLVRGAFATEDGSVCALGAVGVRRGLPVLEIDSTEHEELASLLDVAPALVREIEYVNDDEYAYGMRDDGRARWERVRAWVVRHLHDSEAATAGSNPEEVTP